MLEHLEQQKKLTINQWKIFAAVTIGDMLDFFDFLLIAFVLAFIVKDWNLTYGQSAAILLSSGISAPLGSLFYGWLADKIGRRKVMIITILNFSIATGLMALTPEHGWVFLVICRVLVGFGAFAFVSVAGALVFESVAGAAGWTGSTLAAPGVVAGALTGAGGAVNVWSRIERGACAPEQCPPWTAGSAERSDQRVNQRLQASFDLPERTSGIQRAGRDLIVALSARTLGQCF